MHYPRAVHAQQMNKIPTGTTTVCRRCHPGRGDVKSRAGKHTTLTQNRKPCSLGHWVPGVYFFILAIREHFICQRQKEKLRKAKKGSQCLSSGCSAAGVAQKGKKKKEEASRCGKEMDQSSEIPPGHQQNEERLLGRKIIQTAMARS